jgi:hypothetical protein
MPAACLIRREPKPALTMATTSDDVSHTGPDQFSLCARCCLDPWSKSMWEKLEADENSFTYQVYPDQLADRVKAKCWWCCVVLDTLYGSGYNFTKLVDVKAFYIFFSRSTFGD